jgi:hypothetical protein
LPKRPDWRRFVPRLRTLLFAAAAGGATTAGAPGAAQAAITRAEQAAWDKARGSGSADAFQRYLELYPTGQFAEDAFRILVEKSWRSPSRIEPAAGPPGEPAGPDRGQVVAAAQSIY